MIAIAETYMEKIGFGVQPYLVYKHMDAGHPHIHIVTTTIQADGRRIDTFNIGKNQSAAARKEIEKEFQLVNAALTKSEQVKMAEPAQAIYGLSETRQAITNLLTNVLSSYNYTTLPELNAILSLYNVRADRGKEGSITFHKKGLYYHLLDKQGTKIGVPVKASLIYNRPTLKKLEQRFEENKVDRIAPKRKLRTALDQVLSRLPQSLEHFIAMLQAVNIRTVLRKNEEGKHYGITFIDMNTKAVFNGSDIGKEYSIAKLQTLWIKDGTGNNQTQQQSGITHDTDEVQKPGSNETVQQPGNSIDQPALKSNDASEKINHQSRQQQSNKLAIPHERTMPSIGSKAKRANSAENKMVSSDKDLGKPPFELVRKKRKKRKKT